MLEPIRQKLGLAKLNFQVLRRTLSTRAVAEKLGSIKDVQNLYRHTSPDTALLNYIKDVPESVFQMVDAVYDAILGTATTDSLASAEVKTVQ